jgi:uncharacterized protein (TIGR02466 family)
MKDRFSIIELFPKAVYTSNIERPFSKKELIFFDKNLKNISPNVGNVSSFNSRILNDIILKNLKKQIDKHIENYIYNILKFNKRIKPFITQSWLNVTNKDQHHHTHCHSNSFISGVLYISVNEGQDNIKFYSRDRNFFEDIPIEYNRYNSTNWFISVKCGDLILFRSDLQHGVDRKIEKFNRISLAFNVFIRGSLGEELHFNKLEL